MSGTVYFLWLYSGRAIPVNQVSNPALLEDRLPCPYVCKGHMTAVCVYYILYIILWSAEPHPSSEQAVNGFPMLAHFLSYTTYYYIIVCLIKMLAQMAAHHMNAIKMNHKNVLWSAFEYWMLQFQVHVSSTATHTCYSNPSYYPLIVFPTCVVDSSWASWTRCRTACPLRLQTSQDPRDYWGYWCLFNGWCLDEHSVTKLNAFQHSGT